MEHEIKIIIKKYEKKNRKKVVGKIYTQNWNKKKKFTRAACANKIYSFNG